MTSTTAKMRLVVTWVLRVLLGLIFLGIGIEKLTGTMGTIPFFDAIGWGDSGSAMFPELWIRQGHCSS